VHEFRAVLAAAAGGGIERVYWYSVEDVDWKAQREINLPWGPDPHDYATGLTPDLEREIQRVMRRSRFRRYAARSGGGRARNRAPSLD
jgi:hypothetical protein